MEPMITVVKRGTEQAAGTVRFSIGRRSSGTGPGCIPAHALANPYGVKPHSLYTREKSLAKYEGWLEHKVEMRDAAVCAALNMIWQAARQGDVELECFCAPLGCHRHGIKRVIEAKL